MIATVTVVLALMVVWLTVALAASIWFLHEIVKQDRDMAALEERLEGVQEGKA